MGKVLLSLFPGVDLFGRAFSEEGFCVVRGPDLIFGGDVRAFDPPAGVFWGVFGGPPCQDFSGARRASPSGYGAAMLAEFSRIVTACRPAWYLLENVPRCPDVRVDGYAFRRLDVNQSWYSGVSRLRHVQFGSVAGVGLQVPRGRPVRGAEPAAMASDGRTFRELCRLQGLPDSFDLPGFTVEGKKRAVGNGVPWAMGRILARAVRSAFGMETGGDVPRVDPAACRRRVCRCGCGRVVMGRAVYASAACRKRAQRARDRAE